MVGAEISAEGGITTEGELTGAQGPRQENQPR
ncbi:hypothetical protein SMQC13_45480 [Serratia marcescens]|nr:hypothetical protein SMQC13_45480 [Serratia marcescens]